MMHRVRLIAAGVIVAVVIVAALPASADSVGGIKEFGWWTKRPGAQPTPNGFEVANGPDGEESVAALRIALTGSVTQATLKFTESTDPNVAKVSGTPAIKVCLTTSSWAAEQQGTFDKAPKEDCASSVKMTVDAKGTWTADITSLLAGKSGDVSVMAVPDATPTAGVVPSTFNRQFGAPLANTDGTPGPASTSGGGGTSTYTPPTVPQRQIPANQAFPTPPPAPIPLNSNGTFNAPASAPTPTTQANVVSPQGITVGVAHSAPHKEWGRLLLYVPLAAVLGLLYVRVRKVLLDRGLVPAS